MTTTVFSGTSSPIASPDELVDYFRKSEKPREAWRVGTEHEKFGFYLATGQPLPYEGERGIRALLEGFVQQFGWEPVLEGENLIALLRGGAGITLEPGGQLELSGAPLHTAHETCSELSGHLRELHTVTDPWGVVWLAVGRNPLIPTRDMPWMPKERYAIMRRYLPTRGSQAIDMMAGTGTVQTNLDYGSEEDMALKMAVGMALAPFLNALFANSPFAEGAPTGFRSTRGNIWMDTDPDRCGIIPAVLRRDFGYQDYVEYALDAPMFFIYRDGHYHDLTGRSFRTFLAEGLDGFEATHEDWHLHLTTLFPEVRLKNIIELRMADMGPIPMVCAFSALSRGLFYDETSLKAAAELVRGLSAEQLTALQHEVARKGLRAEVGGRPVREWLRDVISLASSGLERLNAQDADGENEVKFLNPLRRIVDSGQTQADMLLEAWRGDWRQRMERIFTSDAAI